MALTNLHTYPTTDAYQTDRNLSIKIFENDPLRQQTTRGLLTLRPYFDANASQGGSIAIGYGFDLLVHTNAQINAYLAAARLGTLSITDMDYLDTARAVRNAGTANQAVMEQIISQFTEGFTLGSEPNATALLDAYITQTAEVQVRDFLAGLGITWGECKERAALISLTYNNPELLGVGLAAALSLTNPHEARAEAWYQIRYSHADQLWSRRYREATLFGLTDAAPYGQTVAEAMSEDEARSVYRMYTKHNEEIIRQDKKNSGIDSLTASLQPVADYLIKQFGRGQTFNALDIHVAETNDSPTMAALGIDGGYVDRSTDTQDVLIIGGANADLFHGGSDSDVLYGGGGNDILYGEGGNDLLEGGGGNDTYVYKTGDGLDTILDTDGNGTLQIDNNAMSGGEQFGDNKVFRGKDANGASHLYTFVTGDRTTGGDLMVDGAMLIKGYNPTAGNHMGITFSDAAVVQNPQAPAMPTTTRDITGDAQRREFTYTMAVNINPDPAWKWNILSQIENAHFENRTDVNGNSYSVRIVDSITYTYNQQDDLDNWILDPSKPDATQADGLNGSAGNDHIMSGGGGDSINATQGGDDLIEVGDGNNTISAGSGNDVIIGGINNDTINAGNGNNYIIAGNGINSVTAGTGNDIIQTGDGRDIIQAGNGDNYVEAGAERDWLYAGTGKDTLIGGADADVLSGGAGDDHLYADVQLTAAAAIAAGNLVNTGTGQQGDWLAGGEGDDTLIGSTAKDVLMGGDGTDLLVGGAGDDDILGDTNWMPTSLNWNVLDGTDGVRYFTPVSDPFPTTGAADVIYAGEGNDRVEGEFGNDILFGEGGVDKLYGGQGNDIIAGGTGNDILDGGSGSDFYLYKLGDGSDELTETGTPSDLNILSFGAGIALNDLRLSANASGYQIDLANGSNIKLNSLGENLQPFPDIPYLLADTEVGPIQRFDFADGSSVSWKQLVSRGFDQTDTTASATVQGTHVNDRLTGGRNATLVGGLGSDIYNYKAGDGVMHVVDNRNGTDSNVLRLGAGITSNQIRLGLGSLKLDLGPSTGSGQARDEIHIDNFDRNDVFNSASIDHFEFDDGTTLSTTELLARGFDLDGTEGDDLIEGTNTVDRMHGKAGNDTLDAGAGNDVLLGGAGADDLQGGDGNDWIEGGTGNDTLLGGNGADTFMFRLGDGQDTLDNADHMDTLHFGANIAAASVTASVEANGLRLNYGNQGDSVLLVGNTPRELHFADGSSLETAQLFVAQGGMPGRDITGTADSETLIHTSIGVGSISGGAGDDTLMGGSRSTTYRIGLGDGADNIVDLGGADALSFGPGITVSDIRFAWEDNGDLSPKFKVHYGQGGDVVSILNGETGAVERFDFADGTSYSFAEMAALQGFVAPNVAPAVGNVLIQSWDIGNKQLVVGTSADETIEANNDGASEMVIVAGAGDDNARMRCELIAANEADFGIQLERRVAA